MKTASLAPLLATCALALWPAATLSESSTAESTTFLCGAIDAIPATIARNAQSEVAIILWNSSDIGASEDTPQKRCEEVSQKFQTYFEAGKLSYITTGKMNGQLVACIAPNAGDACSGELFALKSDEINPKSALQRILRIRVPADGPISETALRVYISLDKYLNGEYPSLAPIRLPASRSLPAENSPQ